MEDGAQVEMLPLLMEILDEVDEVEQVQQELVVLGRVSSEMLGEVQQTQGISGLEEDDEPERVELLILADEYEEMEYRILFLELQLHMDEEVLEEVQ